MAVDTVYQHDKKKIPWYFGGKGIFKFSTYLVN